LKTILLTVAYDGTNYCGWQRQTNGTAVQETLENAVSSAIGLEVSLTGASRTDSGVHAMGQRACFSIDNDQLRIPLGKLALVINQFLPGDIRVLAAVEACEGFHPAYAAKRKTYEYVIENRAHHSPKQRLYSYHVPAKLDLGAMRRAAASIIGEHDFSAFRSANGYAKTAVRTVYSLELIRDEKLITLRISGNGFLYNMVRIIAGTLIDVGTGKIPPESVGAIIASRDRTKAGITVPPQGLTLMSVEY
jgi:tRNA pseudouridine38-40 synthase